MACSYLKHYNTQLKLELGFELETQQENGNREQREKEREKRRDYEFKMRWMCVSECVRNERRYSEIMYII